MSAELKSAPAGGVPLCFIVFGLICLAGAAIWIAITPAMVLRDYYTAHTVAWAHLLILGFIMSIVMGALYQIAPVALEARLYSHRLAKFHFLCHAVGVLIMVPMFYFWNIRVVGYGGLVVYAGMLLFVYNVGRTLARVPKPDVVAAYIASSLLWLFLTMSAGLLIAADKLWSFLPPGEWMLAHAHLGIGGVFVNLIAGVSLRLVPMFALGKIQSQGRAWLAYVLVNAGIAWLFSGLAFGLRPLAGFSASAVAAGLAIYLWEIAAIFAARERKRLDSGLWMFFASLVLIIPSVAAGFAAPIFGQNFPRVQNLYALLILFGVVCLGIIGMLHKILPFLVWHRVYSRRIGRQPVPSLAGMLSARLQRWTLFLYLASLVLFSAGILAGERLLVLAGAWCWMAAIALFLGNAILVLRHLSFQDGKSVLAAAAPAKVL